MSGAYIFLIFLLRSLIPEELTSSPIILSIPLVALAIFLGRDLLHQSTRPSELPTNAGSQRFRAREVQLLTTQVRVASTASRTFFETIILARLRDLFAEKVSLETGIEKENVKAQLADSLVGPALVHDRTLYRLLYSKPPRTPAERVNVLREAIDRIEAWKT